MLNLRRRNGHNYPSEADEAAESWSVHHCLPESGGLIDMHERISRKQRDRHIRLSIAPGVTFRQERQIDLKVFLTHQRGHFLLESVARPYGKPLEGCDLGGVPFLAAGHCAGV